MACFNCPSHQFRYKEVATVGKGDCELLLVGDYPRDVDNISGYPFTGSEYQFLWDLLAQIGVSYYVTYLMKCVPVDPVTKRYTRPTWDIYGTCYETRFIQEVEHLKPKLVLFLGQNALEMFLREPSKIAPYRGFPKSVTIGNHETRMLATYSPTFILRSDTKDINVKQFHEDIVSACRYAQGTADDIQTITVNVDQLERLIDIWVEDSNIEYVAYDTESNGLDPLVPGSKITSLSVAVDEYVGYNIFLYHPELDISDDTRTRIRDAVEVLLTSKKVVAHHAKHEHRFTKVVFGFTPNIVEDTMYMSFILYLADPTISHGLKYLSGRFAGMPPWEEYTSRYLDLFKTLRRNKTIDDDKIIKWLEEYSDIDLESEDIMRFYSIIHDPDYPIKQQDSEDTDIYMWMIPVRVLEKYAGYDAVAPLRLMKVFKPQINSDEGLVRAYNLMVKGAETFANVELHGVRINDIDLWTNIYDEKLSESLDDLRQYPEVRKFEQDNGEIYNPNSTKHSTEVFYKNFKFPVLGTTGKGNPSLAEPTLLDLIKHYQGKEGAENNRRENFLITFREYKKLGKIMSSYLVGLRRYIRPNDAFDGHTCEYLPTKRAGEEYLMMHPGYSLHGTDCVVAGTQISTEYGKISIELLAECDTPERGFYPIKHVRVFDGEEFRYPLYFYYGGLRDTLKIKAGHHHEITCTPEHPLWVEYQGWVQAQDLKVGDPLRVYMEDHQGYSLEQVRSIEYAGIQEVYDITMDEEVGDDRRYESDDIDAGD